MLLENYISCVFLKSYLIYFLKLFLRLEINSYIYCLVFWSSFYSPSRVSSHFLESPRHDVSKGATPKQEISPKKSGNPGTSSSSSDKRQTLIKNTKQLFGARMNSPKVGKYFKHFKVFSEFLFFKEYKMGQKIKVKSEVIIWVILRHMNHHALSNNWDQYPFFVAKKYI